MYYRLGMNIIVEYVTQIMLSHESNAEMEKLLDLWEKIIDQRAPLHRTIGVYGTEPDENSQSHLAYPLNQFRLIKRFVEMWATGLTLYYASVSQDQVSSIPVLVY